MMQYITKNSPPSRFLWFCRQTGATYDNMTGKVKKKLRKALMKEQGHICCYCGMSLTTDRASVDSEKSFTIVEHLKSKTNYAHLRLEYTNLLASCDGGQQERENSSEGKQKRKKLFPSQCDDHKGSKDIPITPLCQTCGSRFMYDNDGSMLCDLADSDAQRTIDILNLDNPVLRNKRKAVIFAYENLGINSKDEWELELEKVSQQDSDGKYKPFCFVAQSYIRNQIIPRYNTL